MIKVLILQTKVIYRTSLTFAEIDISQLKQRVDVQSEICQINYYPIAKASARKMHIIYEFKTENKARIKDTEANTKFSSWRNYFLSILKLLVVCKCRSFKIILKLFCYQLTYLFVIRIGIFNVY